MPSKPSGWLVFDQGIRCSPYMKAIAWECHDSSDHGAAAQSDQEYAG